jgi:hypothetical protein
VLTQQQAVLSWQSSWLMMQEVVWAQPCILDGQLQQGLSVHMFLLAQRLLVMGV